MSPPRAFVFDIGNVLLEFDYGIAIRRLVRECAISEAEMHRLLNQSRLLHNYETGLITTEAFFDQVRAASGYRGSLDDFAQWFADIFTEIAPMRDLHSAVRRGGYPAYLFSNTNELAVRFMRARFPFFNDFDGAIFSFEQRCMKPDHRLYEALECLSGLRGSDIFYMDDRPENVAAGLERGWRAVMHTDPRVTTEAIRRLGVRL